LGPVIFFFFFVRTTQQNKIPVYCWTSLFYTYINRPKKINSNFIVGPVILKDISIFAVLIHDLNLIKTVAATLNSLDFSGFDL
jgi:hypothetical protein